MKIDKKFSSLRGI